MLELKGNLEVFQNKNGYVTGVIKAWDEDNHTVLGKVFMDVKLPKEITIKEGQSLTLDVKKAYLNAVYVEGENGFTKLKINVVECEVIRVFPEEKKVKTSKRGKK